MKKHYLSFITAIILCLASVPVYAEERVIYESGNTDIPVEYTAESHFSVSIPEVINLNDSSFSMTFFADITDSEVINVSIGSSRIELTNASGKTGVGFLNDSTGTQVVEYEPIIQYMNGYDSIQSFEYLFRAEDIPAGKWTGAMTFYIQLD